MPAVFAAAPLPRGLAIQTTRPDRVWPSANRRGAHEAVVPEEDMKRVAAARSTGCYRNPYQTPLSTPAAAAAPTHTSTGANVGRHWAREEGRGRVAKREAEPVAHSAWLAPPAGVRGRLERRG
jgi:hypothetical protein